MMQVSTSLKLNVDADEASAAASPWLKCHYMQQHLGDDCWWW